MQLKPHTQLQQQRILQILVPSNQGHVEKKLQEEHLLHLALVRRQLKQKSSFFWSAQQTLPHKKVLMRNRGNMLTSPHSSPAIFAK